MKRISMVFFCIIIISISFTLSSCSYNKGSINTETMLKIDSSYCGAREMTCIFPHEIFSESNAINSLDNAISSNCPQALTYERTIIENNDISYKFFLNFNSFNDYSSKLESILGYYPGVVYSNPQTIFIKGTRLSENFSSAELLKWIIDSIKLLPDKSFSSLSLNNKSTSVYVNGANQITSEFIQVNAVTSLPLDSITINTTCNLNGTFDRTISFKIPKSTMDELSKDIDPYMNSRTSSCESLVKQDYSSGTEYIVQYKQLDFNRLSYHTNELLNSRLCGKISYTGNQDRSGIFFDSWSLKETIDTSNYSGYGNLPVTLNYNYKIINNNIENNGAKIYDAKKLAKGSFVKINSDDANVSFSNKDYSTSVDIPNGSIFKLYETDIALTTLDGNKFNKTIDFVFSKDDFAGPNHASQRLSQYNSKYSVSLSQSEKGNICKLSLDGTIDDLNQANYSIFGEGNIMSYNDSANLFSIHRKQRYKDKINLTSIYTSENQNSPIYYTIGTKQNQTLTSASCRAENMNEKNVNIKNISKSTFKLDNPNSVIIFNTNSPNIFGAFIAILLVLIVILSIIIVIVMLKKGNFRPRKPLLNNDINNFKTPDDKTIKDILSDI